MQPFLGFRLSPTMRRLRPAIAFLQTSARFHQLRPYPQALFLPHQKISSPCYCTESSPPQHRTQTQVKLQKPSYKLSYLTLSLPSTPSPSYDPSVPLFDRAYDGAWANAICSHGGGPPRPAYNKDHNVFVCFIGFRCTSPSIDSETWARFTEKCEKWMLMQWEHEAANKADPEDMRRYFKIAWVEDVDVQQVHVDLTVLRKKFGGVVKNINPKRSENRDALHATWDAFLYADDAAVFSLLSPSSGQIPFVHAVGYYNEGAYDEDPLDPEGQYKVAIELLGHFWCKVGAGSMGMDEIGPVEVGDVCTVVGIEPLFSDEIIGKMKEELLKL